MKTTFTFLAILACITSANAQPRTKTIFRYGEEVNIKPDTAITVKKFTATPRDGKVYLNWVVFNSLKNGMYVIERAADGQEFEVVGFKKGIPTTLPLDLAFYYTDNFEANGKVIYKVTHIAEDNTYFEFPEVVVKGKRNAGSMAFEVGAPAPVLSIAGAIINSR